MAAVLDVWIARPGDACRVDDNAWIVEVDDSRGNVFEWAGTSYANLAAPHAHWAGAIPPGCYVVHALNARTGVRTDHAIVCVDCTGTACVHLFVGGPVPPDCNVKIQNVLGIGSSVASSIQVTGTAAHCTSVQVSVTCETGQAATTVVSVSPGGGWTATIGSQNLRCICGKIVKVTAQCVQHPECRDEFQSDALKCSAGTRS